MPLRSDEASRARAEALFTQREQQKAVPPRATAEYQAAQQAALDRMHELRRLRLRARRRVAVQALRAGSSTLGIVPGLQCSSVLPSRHKATPVRP